MKKTLLSLLGLVAAMAAEAQTADMKVSVKNPTSVSRKAVPVELQLESPVGSALVRDAQGAEIPCQLDDIDGDGRYESLSFIVGEIGAKKSSNFTVTLSEGGQPRKYEAQVYAEMMLTNKKIKSTNKQDLYISSLTVDNGTNPYWMLHHHGPAFENDMVAYRIYFDERQTVDIYGKYRKGLELKDTQFYPDSDQKAAGYGDDVLWVGNTFGLGAFRGWDGSAPTMLEDVEHRTQRIVATGPLRTIVEVEDNGWTIRKGDQPVNATIRYTLYAGHRDFDVDVTFNRNVKEYDFSTGIINVKNSVELTDGNGLRGCWGTDWPAGTSDTINWKRETVGLGIYVPDEYRKQEIPANKDNYAYVIACKNNQLHYSLVYTSDNEDFGYHSDKEWFSFLKEWKKQKQNPVTINIK